LLEPLGEGFLSRFLDRYGEGLHHITFKTDDIREAKEYLQPSNIEELLG
jgi:4-hydroxyphenylpyruvate dioxygenase-like putative hemolysin